MKKKLLLFVAIFSCILMYSQSDSCEGATPFCTIGGIGFDAPVGADDAPLGPDYGCLLSQPNPAFYNVQIDQPGNLTITMQSTPALDIDFICWGPFSTSAGMCDNINTQTGAPIVDCSYSTAAIEVCDIPNAIADDWYVILITNYSGVANNIDFASSAVDSATTTCCPSFDINNFVTFCSGDIAFLMEDQLAWSSDISIGVGNQYGWYNIIPSTNDWISFGGNIFDPSLNSSGNFSYIFPVDSIPGANITCPDDTAYLNININPEPIIFFPAFDDVCSDAIAINLNSATPSGGTYSVNGINSTIFTPNISLLGSNIITYEITDGNGCYNTKDTNIIVNDVPILSLGLDTMMIPCSSNFLIEPILTGGNSPFDYLWSNGSSASNLNVSDGIIDLTVTDVNGCIAIDTIIIVQNIPPTAQVTGGLPICIGSSSSIIFESDALPPWNLVYSNGSVSDSIFNLYTPFQLDASTAGDYEILAVIDSNGCEADILGLGIVSLTVFPLPVAIISPSEVTIYKDQEIELTVGDYSFYDWYSIDSILISSDDFLKVTTSGNFYVEVTDQNGCISSSNIAVVNVVQITQLFVPNSFTPNDDNHNELFVISGDNIEIFNLKIFDRWGEELFESNSIGKHWDGVFNNNKVQQGTYYYYLEVYGEDGNLFVKSGNVNVIY